MYNFKDDARPHLEIEIGGVKIMGLLDSGADCSLIGKGWEYLVAAAQIDIQDSGTIVITADGTHHIGSKSANLSVSHNGKCRKMRFILMPQLSKKLILGMDFFRLFNIKLKVCSALNGMVSSVVNGNKLNEYDLSQLAEIIKSFPRSTDDKIGRTNVLKHNIDTGDNIPIKQRYYPVSPYVQKDMDAEYDRMLRMGVIEKSKSPWSNPMVCVRKSNGKIRLCLDCRKLNDVTKKDSYPVPYITRILGNIRGTKFLSKIDLKDAFWQVGLEESSKERTAFTIPGRGLYQFKVMPFGLSNAVQTQCRLMDSVLGFDMEPYVFAYLDDIIIATNELSSHIHYLKETARRLMEAGLTINLQKSEFCIPRIKYLGYILDEEGLKTDDSKVDGIRNFPTPSTAKEVKRFLGMAGWYRRFINNFSSIVAPITQLTTKKAGKFKWNEEAEKSFNLIKDALCSAPVLSMPDFSKPFTIHTDASDVGVGGVLVQGEGLEEKVISYMSHKLTTAQRKYSTTERECLAVLLAIEHFRAYIEGSKFSVITDHSSLSWLQKLKDPVGRLGRWILKLQQYDCKIIHRKGTFNVVPDALSRAFVNEIDIRTVDWQSDQWYVSLRKKIIEKPIKYPDYEVKGEAIYKHCAKGQDGKVLPEYEWKIVAPKNIRNQILNDNHDEPSAAHLGYYKTLNRIKEKFYWPMMAKDIMAYVRNCDPCKANKSPTYVVRHEMGNTKPLTDPWRVVAVDYLGPLPRSKKGNNFMLVALDCFTKYTIIEPVRKADTKSAVKILDQVFTKFGVPEILISDNGTPFVSKNFEDFLKQYNIKQWKNAVYHPQHNPAERPNKVIAAAIRNYIGNDHRVWDEEITKISSALNSARHQSSKYSPYFLNFGRDMVLSGLTHHINDQRKALGEIEETPEEFQERIDSIRNKVEKNLKEAYNKYSANYNLRARIVTYVPGEIVWRKDFSLSDACKNYSAKLSPKYIKCKIRKKLGKSTYLLEELDGRIVKNPYSVSDLKKN